MPEQKKYVRDREELPQVSAKLLPPFFPIWLRERLRDLKGAPLSVFVIYGSRANKEGLAWPSLGLLSKESGYGIRKCKEARALLIGMGLLIPVRQERVEGGKFGRMIFAVPWSLFVRGAKRDPR